MKLNPEDLVISSFETSDDELQFNIAPTIDNPNDPTPATWCRICPVGTGDCY
jgi:hypothetical protein